MYVVSDYTFTPDTGAGYEELVVAGVYGIERFVSIENATRNDVLYSAVEGHIGSIVVADDGVETTVRIYGGEKTSEAGDNIIFDNWADSGTNNATINVQGRSYADDQDVGAVVALTAGGANQAAVKGQLQLDSTVLFSVASSVANSDLTGLAAAGGVAQAVEESIEGVDVTTAAGAQDAIAIIDGALAKIDRNRATLGAVQNRLQSTINNLANIVENSSGARARIRDTDFAKETAEMTRNQILQQAGTSILAQANQLPQAALSLLGQ